MSTVNIEIPDDGWFSAECDTEPSKGTIDKILLETGFSYEECFKEIE